MISLYRLELAPLVSTHAIIAWDGRMEEGERLLLVFDIPTMILRTQQWLGLYAIMEYPFSVGWE